MNSVLHYSDPIQSCKRDSVSCTAVLYESDQRPGCRPIVCVCPFDNEVCMCIHKLDRIWICIYPCMCACMYLSLCKCVCVCVYWMVLARCEGAVWQGREMMALEGSVGVRRHSKIWFIISVISHWVNTVTPCEIWPTSHWSSLDFRNISDTHTKISLMENGLHAIFFFFKHNCTVVCNGDPMIWHIHSFIHS